MLGVPCNTTVRAWRHALDPDGWEPIDGAARGARPGYLLTAYHTLAMAQRVVHQVAQVLAPSCVPLFLTDGLKEYATALLTHFGYRSVK